MGCIIKGDSLTASGGKAFLLVGIKASLTCHSIKQAAHDVGTGGVTMAEAEEDLVAYLWDENEAAVALYVFAATTIWCHHTHPTCSHVIGLPIHAHLHTTCSVWVGIAEHGCHLCFSQWHTQSIGIKTSTTNHKGRA